MTLYTLLYKISEILTPQTHSLYEYMLHTFDDNGFLRTRYCRWDSMLKDRKIGEVTKALVCFRSPFKEGDEYCEEETFGDEERFCQLNTLVKMQVFWYQDDVGAIDGDIEWSRELRYSHPYVLDIVNGKVEQELD